MTKIDSNRLADLLKEARGRLRLSQAQLGAKLGVTRQAVSLWEGGQSVPQAQQLHAIEQTLGIEVPMLGAAPTRHGLIAASDARGVRLAALRMSEVVTQLLREAVEAEQAADDAALAARAIATTQAHAAATAAAADRAAPARRRRTK